MSHNDMTTAQKNLTQAAEIETSSAWTKARLIASSVEIGQHGRPSKGLPESFKYGLKAAKPGPKSSVPQGTKLGVKDAAKVMGR